MKRKSFFFRSFAILFYVNFRLFLVSSSSSTQLNSQLRSPIATAILASTTARSATCRVRGRRSPRALPKALSKASSLPSARRTAAEVAAAPSFSSLPRLEGRPPASGDLERCCCRLRWWRRASWNKTRGVARGVSASAAAAEGARGRASLLLLLSAAAPAAASAAALRLRALLAADAASSSACRTARSSAAASTGRISSSVPPRGSRSGRSCGLHRGLLLTLSVRLSRHRTLFADPQGVVLTSTVSREISTHSTSRTRSRNPS